MAHREVFVAADARRPCRRTCSAASSRACSRGARRSSSPLPRARPSTAWPTTSATARPSCALESRAFPLLVYDPDAGELARRVPRPRRQPGASTTTWPTLRARSTRTRTGASRPWTLPLTIADWAATRGPLQEALQATREARRRGRALPRVPRLDAARRSAATRSPFIYTLDAQAAACRRPACPSEIVRPGRGAARLLAPLGSWPGSRCPSPSHDLVRGGARGRVRRQGRGRSRAEYEAKLAELQARPTRGSSRAAWPRACCAAGDGTHDASADLLDAGAVHAGPRADRPESTATG